MPRRRTSSPSCRRMIRSRARRSGPIGLLRRRQQLLDHGHDHRPDVPGHPRRPAPSPRSTPPPATSCGTSRPAPASPVRRSPTCMTAGSMWPSSPRRANPNVNAGTPKWRKAGSTAAARRCMCSRSPQPSPATSRDADRGAPPRLEGRPCAGLLFVVATVAPCKSSGLAERTQTRHGTACPFSIAVLNSGCLPRPAGVTGEGASI